MMPNLHLVLLGHPEILLNSKPLQINSNKARALLFYLAVTRQTHSRQALAGLLWGDMTEERARDNLRVELTKLRPISSTHLIPGRHSMAFNRESNHVLDTAVFETNLLRPSPTIEQLQTAVSLYRGNFLEDFFVRDAPLFEEWLRPQQERYRKLALDALYRLYTHFTEQRHYSKAIEYTRHVLQLEPWLEEAHRQLMLLLALTGQRSSALAQFEICRSVLEEELAADPSEATVLLYEQILDETITPDSASVSALAIAPAEKPTPLLPPFQAPALIAHFVGREKELETIQTQLTRPVSPTIYALVGMGGAGKTAVSIHTAHALHTHFMDGVLWANATTSEPMTILEGWAQAYGHDFSRLPDVESRAAAFRSLLANKKVLFVLDGVVSLARVRPLLPNNPGCAVLITTRDQDLARALNATVLPITELPLENGRSLLVHILGQDRVTAEPQAADEICTILSNLPLALEITAQRLASRPRRRLSDMAERLQNETDRLSELSISDRQVRASFEVSWEALDHHEKQAFNLLGVFEGRPFTAEALAYIAQLDRYTAEDRLFALAALSLVAENGQSHYRQHPLLADFAREKLGDAPEKYGRFAAYYLSFAQQHQRQYDTLRPEWGNLMAGMQKAYQHQLWHSVMAYAATLTEPWFRRGRYTQARRGYQWAVNAAQTEQNLAAQAQYLHQWGLACLEQRDFTQAIHYLTQSIQIFQTVNDLAGIAQSQCDLARIALEQTNYDQAQTLLIDSRDIREELNDSIGIAETLHVEARVCYFRGDHHGAAHLAKQALNLLTHPIHEAKTIRTLNLLASISIMQGDLETAESYAQNALQLSERLQDKGDQAMILNVLADVNRRQGQLDRAKTHAEKGLELLKTVGDLGSQAGVLYQLTLIHLGQNQSQTALEFGLQSLELCQLSQSHLQKMWSLIYVGDCYKNLGQEAQALETWQEAWHLAHTLQHPTAIQRLKDRLGDL